MKKTLLLLLFIVALAVYLWWGIYLPKSSNQAETSFLVEKGQSVSQIAKNLENQGFIKNKLFFRIYLAFSGKYKKLQAGNYFLVSSMNVPEIAKKLALGETAKRTITIIEGWNLRDIGWYFEGQGMFQAEELFELVGFPAIDYSKVEDLPALEDFSEDFDFLKDKSENVGLEGYLFPDTYEININEPLEEIVNRMLDNFNNKLTTELREEIEGQGKTVFDILIMASLLEKEVKTKEDKEIVSGLLWKRLENSFPLQVDATISYDTGKKSTEISIEETKIDSSFNTYKYLGLPVGPICNPGLESILASIRPKSSDFWYYLSTPEGETIFSKTLEEHNLAKQKYLK